MRQKTGILSIWHSVFSYKNKMSVSGGICINRRQEMDKEDESENNRVCIFRVVCLEVEEEADGLCLSLNENFQWRKQMSTSYLTIPDSCNHTHKKVCFCVSDESLCVLPS